MTTTPRDFYKELPENLKNEMPDIFFEQAKANWDCHLITGDLIKERYVTLELNDPQIKIDPTSGEEFVSAKFQLYAIVNETVVDGHPSIQLVKQQKGATGGKKLRGHNSPALRFNQQMVKLGLISQDELKLLIAYCHYWESNRDNHYAKGDSRTTRLYLTVKDSVSDPSQAQFTFKYRQTQNPNTSEQTLGLDNIGWSQHLFQFIGWSVTQTQDVSVAQAPAAAGAPDLHLTRGVVTLTNQPVGSRTL